jgi:periplasmic protein TonB
MERMFREELAAGSKAVWLWALVGSLAIHFSLMAVALSWKTQLPAKPKRVVPVEAITLTQALPGPTGGGGGLPKPAAAAALKPKPAPPPVVKPKPRRVVKPKPQVRKTVRKPRKVEAPEPPPSLALPRPASPATASASGRTTASLGRSTASARRRGGPGSGSGAGSGRGSGSGSGVGKGPGPGAGSLLQGYLRQVRRLLERQKKYPRMAQRMNMQGVVLLQFTIAADGGIQATRLCRTSGHDLLDEAARQTVRRVGRFPPLPSGLGRQKLAVQIPLAFRLTN